MTLKNLHHAIRHISVLAMPLVTLSFTNAAEEDIRLLEMAIQTAPTYQGSDRQTTTLQPVVLLEHGIWYLSTDRGVGYRWPANDDDSQWIFGQSIAYDSGRTERKRHAPEGDERLKGMGKISGSMLTRVEAGYRFTPWLTVLAEYEQPLSNRERGQRWQVSLEGGLWESTADTIWYQLLRSYGSKRYQQTHFGVSTTQAASSGYRPYTIGASHHYDALTIGWDHQFNRQWSSTLSLGWQQLGSKPSASPLVRQRSSATGFAALNYQFQ